MDDNADLPRARGEKAPVRIGLVGATGLLGRTLIEITSAGDHARIVGIARREIAMPPGARMELFVADPAKWGEVLEAVRPRALICALGTTWRKAGRDAEGFRAVDQTLIVDTAKAAKAAGIPNLVLVSAAGASVRSRNLYFQIKGETETLVTKIGFKRLDILRPGLLRGEREGDFRPLERAALARFALGHSLSRRRRAMRAVCGVARQRAHGIDPLGRGRRGFHHDRRHPRNLRERCGRGDRLDALSCL
jgi:uncharacterized protein YbjT (DUF2867 family)